MKQVLSVTLLHKLPGRIRIRLSKPPRRTDRFVQALRSHDGVGEVNFSKPSLSILINYGKGHLTTEEILLRSAVALSLEYGDLPVQVMVQPGNEVMTDGAVLAGILLAGAAMIRWSATKKSLGLIDKTAGAGVALSVMEHGWREAREQGYIDPELLSLGYLLTSYFRGNIFRGALITWIACFGRHLLSGEEKCIEVGPLKTMDKEDHLRSYLVKMAKIIPRQTPLLNFFRSLLGIAGIASFTNENENLFGELQNIARAHGEVLEGMAEQSQGIPITFR